MIPVVRRGGDGQVEADATRAVLMGGDASTCPASSLLDARVGRRHTGDGLGRWPV